MNQEFCKVLDVNCALLGVDGNARRICTFSGNLLDSQTQCPIGEPVVKRSQLPRFRVTDLILLGIQDVQRLKDTPTINELRTHEISTSYDKAPTQISPLGSWRDQWRRR